MPVYEYACTVCDHRADILHGINDPGPRFCPSCGREGTMRKLFAPPTIHFKGSGWAKKDRASSASGSRRAGGFVTSAGGEPPAPAAAESDSPAVPASQASLGAQGGPRPGALRQSGEPARPGGSGGSGGSTESRESRRPDNADRKRGSRDPPSV